MLSIDLLTEALYASLRMENTMAKNLNCAELGYQCAFSVTADDDQKDFMLDIIQQHAAQVHPDLVDESTTLKPAVRERLLDLLMQSNYSKR
jgi:predicted small metal-binding protein